jgi:hypothetical protein
MPRTQKQKAATLLQDPNRITKATERLRQKLKRLREIQCFWLETGERLEAEFKVAKAKEKAADEKGHKTERDRFARQAAEIDAELCITNEWSETVKAARIALRILEDNDIEVPEEFTHILGEWPNGYVMMIQSLKAENEDAQNARQESARHALLSELTQLATKTDNHFANLLTTPPAESGPTKERQVSPILALGNRRYAVSGHGAVTVTYNQDLALQAFLSAGSLDKPLLQNTFNDAPRVLRQLKKQYPDTLGKRIFLPGKKGQGGYAVKIREKR